MLLLIDNYDSFSYNLVQLFSSIESDIRVIRNDAMTIKDIRSLRPSRIVLSPGPGYPKEAGICEEVVHELKCDIPILGVCLGHQAICEAFGASIVHARQLMHGKQSRIRLDNESLLFQGLPDEIPAARYHSLVADPDTMPNDLTITARDSLGEIMAVEHREYPVYGVQFHPESILTPQGGRILSNFISIHVSHVSNHV